MGMGVVAVWTGAGAAADVAAGGTASAKVAGTEALSCCDGAVIAGLASEGWAGDITRATATAARRGSTRLAGTETSCVGEDA